MLFSMSSCEINSISVWYYEILQTWAIKGLARHAMRFCYWLTCWMREGRVDRGQGWHSCAEIREWCHQTRHSSSWARKCFARTPQCLSFRRIGTWRTHKPHLRGKEMQKLVKSNGTRWVGHARAWVLIWVKLTSKNALAFVELDAWWDILELSQVNHELFHDIGTLFKCGGALLESLVCRQIFVNLFHHLKIAKILITAHSFFLG